MTVKCVSDLMHMVERRVAGTSDQFSAEEQWKRSRLANKSAEITHKALVGFAEELKKITVPDIETFFEEHLYDSPSELEGRLGEKDIVPFMKNLIKDLTQYNIDSKKNELVKALSALK